MKILIASNNIHKVREIKSILANSIFPKIKLVTPAEISEDTIEVIENGSNFLENAIIKAKAFYQYYGLPTLSDDSGLEVTALNGLPGIHSARFSGEIANDFSNRLKLINELNKLKLNNSPARFKCIICFYDGDGILNSEGVIEGTVITKERGNGGFGYDPLFVPKGMNLTFSELNEVEKNKISHRSNALKNFLPIFAEYYNKNINNFGKSNI